MGSVALSLCDSKTGPRTVWLSQPARAVLDALKRNGRQVFSASGVARPRSKAWLHRFWNAARAAAGLRDVRLHDLRHTYASHAVMNGVPVHVVARLLGRSNVRVTMRYAHLADRDIEAAAERIGQAIAEIIDIKTPP